MIQFAVQVGLARLLGPEALGQAAAVLLVVGVVGLVAEAGLGSALVQRVRVDDRDVAVALGWLLVASTGMATAVALFAPWLAAALGSSRLHGLLVGAALLVPLQALAALPSALLQRGLRAKRLQAIQLTAYGAAYGGLGLGMAAAGFGAWALVSAFAMHALLVLVLGWLSVRHTLRPRWVGASELRAYGWRITAANLVNWALENVDRLAVSRYWDSAALGGYAVAATLARSPILLLVGAAQPWAFASAARLQDEHLRVGRGYLAALSLGLLFTVPLFVLLAWHADLVIVSLYGTRWTQAAAPFAWLCLSVPFFVMLALTGPLLRGVDAVMQEMRAQLLALAALVVALGWAVGRPLEDVAMMVALSTALRAWMLYMSLAKRITLPAGSCWRALRAPVALGAVAFVACLVCAPLSQATAMAGSTMLAAVAAAFVLRIGGQTLLCAELIEALQQRRAGSRAAEALCAGVGLR